tara:strand:- start:247 stop:981 length:735 start_codon:yes stop_codon:yes gene_type:complete
MLNLINDTQVGIVVPCYNEGSRLDVELFKSFLKKNTHIAILFINDGSKDNTEEILKKITVLDNAEFINCKENHGKAKAVQIGINKLINEDIGYIGYWDADLSTPLNDIIKFLTILKNNSLLSGVIGSRILKLGNNIIYKKKRKYYGRLLMFILYFGPLKNIPVYDSQCGAKLFVKDYARKIFDKPISTNWLFDIEILMRLDKLNPVKDCIFELPLDEWIHKSDSKIGFKDSIGIIKDLIKLYSI